MIRARSAAHRRGAAPKLPQRVPKGKGSRPSPARGHRCEYWLWCRSARPWPGAGRWSYRSEQRRAARCRGGRRRRQAVRRYRDAIDWTAEPRSGAALADCRHQGRRGRRADRSPVAPEMGVAGRARPPARSQSTARERCRTCHVAAVRELRVAQKTLRAKKAHFNLMKINDSFDLPLWLED
jgi:hypothetical protein